MIDWRKRKSDRILGVQIQEELLLRLVAAAGLDYCPVYIADRQTDSARDGLRRRKLFFFFTKQFGSVDPILLTEKLRSRED